VKFYQGKISIAGAKGFVKDFLLLPGLVLVKLIEKIGLPIWAIKNP
jgi:hypothetical protein